MTGFLSGTFILGAGIVGLALAYGAAWDVLAACWGTVWALMAFGAVITRATGSRRPPSVAATARLWDTGELAALDDATGIEQLLADLPSVRGEFR